MENTEIAQMVEKFGKMTPNEQEQFKISINSKLGAGEMRGKVVLVTGGNRGIGKETVEKFAQNGASIVFNSSRFDEKAKEFERYISLTYSVDVTYIPCDVREESQINNLIEEILKKHNRIDVLVNNAGKAYMTSLVNTTLNDFNECVNINLTAPFLFCKKIVPIMSKNKYGRIVNISSGTTVNIQPNLSVYMAAKAGLNLLTKGLALEVAADNITVNSILPGPTDTDMLNNGVAEFAEAFSTPKEVMLAQIVAGNAIKRPVSPKEIADFVYFLSREEAAGITGAIHSCDCGFTI